ncbi:MAG TPA: ATP-dependent helicase [Acidimicrobiales bacterium]|nr:ATP-dependent helicase [Acidimicrobiales bacterium]
MANLLDDLDEEQRSAVLASTGPVCIVAGAGTGKTRTVTYRLAHGVLTGAVDPNRCLAITHSKKAALELARRLHDLGAGAVDARTFHAAGLRVAGQFWRRTGRREPSPNVLSEGESWRIWRDALRAAAGRDPDSGTVRDLVDEVGWARSRLIGMEDYEAACVFAGRRAAIDPPAVVECWRRYEQSKTRTGRVDFADLLDIAARLLDTDEQVAEVVRGRWAHVTVDEYQDTDPAQQRLLDAILGGRAEVCVVGDPRQAIYSWKGADPTYLTQFTKRFPTAQVFDLTRNYRSSPQILAWANALAHERGVKPLLPTRPSGVAPKIRRLDDELAEAAWVAGAIRKAVDAGTSPSEIAVLYRFNATQLRFEASLARQKIATVVADDVPFFERDEIRSVLVPFAQAARADPDRNGLELVKMMFDRSGFDRQAPPAGLGAARSRWESLLALLELVEGLEDAAKRGAASILSDINGLARRTSDPKSEGVTLATLHRAKGLEWDVVFVVGVTDGAIPSTYAETPAQRAEEERLLHVGVTRARRELHLTWATTNGRGWTNRPSPFLDRLPAGQQGPARERSRSAVRSTRHARPSRTEGASKGSASCTLCAAALKGPSARRLGVCADCVLTAPGDLGRRARAIKQISIDAAEQTGGDPQKVVSREGLLRLLDHRPESGDDVSATLGVRLTSQWAKAAAEALRT